MALELRTLPSERSSLPHFAGRKPELARLGALFDDVLDGNTTGGIQLVTGVPGVGKSELGRQFAKAMERRDGVGCLWLDVEELAPTQTIGLFLAIANAVGERRLAAKIAGIDAKITGLSVAALSAKAQVSLDRAKPAFSFGALLRESKGAGMWNSRRGIVLLIDELQTAPAEAMRNLLVLHKGDHGCPIFVVGIGLQHTQDVLAKPKQGAPGLSRMSKPLMLAPLAPDEAREAVAENMAALGCRIPDDCVAVLAQASHGLPQHIHGYLRGALEVIQEHGRIAAGETLAQAVERGGAERTRYYQDRLRSMQVRSPDEAMFPLMKALQAANRETMRESAAVQAYAGTAFDGGAIVDDAIAHGVLTRSPDGEVGFGIPSFRSHLANSMLAGDGGDAANP